MNAIEFALSRIRMAIPSKILDIAFYNHSMNEMLGEMISIDQNIRDLIIRDRVMVVINSINGEMKDVPLHSCKILSGSLLKGYLYQIPKSQTEGRNVISIQNVTLKQMGSAFTGASNYSNVVSGNDMSTLVASSLRKSSIPPRYSFTDFIYRNNNIVFLPTAISMFPIEAHFRCILENDANMTNLAREAQVAFGKLCVLACKGYIYNELLPKLDQGYIEGGAEIGVIKEMIDSYSDANEQFDEFLESTWYITSLYGDQTQRRRATRLMIGGG